MIGSELRVRRESLGLSQRELAGRLGIGQALVSKWEKGSQAPRDPVSVIGVLQDLGEAFLDIVDETIDNLEGASGKLDSPSVRVRAYLTDEAYWAADARASRSGVPASLHRAAVGVAVAMTETEHGVTVTIVTE